MKGVPSCSKLSWVSAPNFRKLEAWKRHRDSSNTDTGFIV
jgi:hypothetical protein